MATKCSVAFPVRQRVFIASVIAEGWVCPIDREKPYQRIGWQKACVAMANKNARILWAVLTREKAYDPRHLSVKPQSKVPVNERAPTTAPTPTSSMCAA